MNEIYNVLYENKSPELALNSLMIRNLKNRILMQKTLYKVKKSKIHNSGLFAKEEIESGTKVIQYLGEKISKNESSKGH